MKATPERVTSPLDRATGAVNAREQEIIAKVYADLRAQLNPAARAMYDAYYKTPAAVEEGRCQRKSSA